MLRFFLRLMWFVIGLAAIVFSLGTAVICSECVAEKRRQGIKTFGGLTVLSGMVAFWTLRRAFARRDEPRFAADGLWSTGDESLARFHAPPMEENEAVAWAVDQGLHLSDVADRLMTLSADTVRKLCEAANHEVLVFRHLKQLSEQAAAALADLCLGQLYFPALTSLSPEAARQLARVHAPLFLDGLQAISAETAAALGSHCGWLTICGLERLSPEAAAGLARHRPIWHLGDMYNRLGLDGLVELPERTAASLATCSGNLSLNGLRVLAPGAARILAQHQAVEAVAESFSLHLDGLETLSDEKASLLAEYRGGLSLNGVERLSPGALRALARHQGQALSLGGLRAMSDDVAALFAARPLHLWVPSLRELSVTARAALQRNPRIMLPDDPGLDAAGG
jgi:hypothetical protein